MSALAIAVLILIGFPVVVMAGYLALLTVCSSRLPQPVAEARTTCFMIIVPAHDEAVGIAATVHSLLALDWPAALRRVLVVADNCSDATATLASDAGAEVIERFNTDLRGKGYALQLAYQTVLAEDWADAVVVVDADTEVTPNLLSAFSAQLGQGAGAVQAFYGVRNPLASWRTRLVTIALAIFHRLRGRARARLRVSNKLNGNGMCFTTATLRQVPHQAFSIAEDLEYGIALGRAGIRVAYADDAEVRAEMVSNAKAAESQRQRWEGGRAQMRQEFGWPLLRDALRQRSLLLLDLAMDVLVPPLAMVAVAVLGFVLLSLVMVWCGWLPMGAAWPALACLVLLTLHVFRGVALSGLGLQGWLDLAFAPGYVLWKLLLKFRRKPAKGEWVRTTREGNSS